MAYPSYLLAEVLKKAATGGREAGRQPERKGDSRLHP